MTSPEAVSQVGVVVAQNTDVQLIAPNPSGHFSCYVNRCPGKFVLRNGKYGKFYGCSEFPRCNATRSVESVEGEYTATVIGEFDPDEARYGW